MFRSESEMNLIQVYFWLFLYTDFKSLFSKKEGGGGFGERGRGVW